MSGATTDRWDAIFSTSILNYKPTLVDNIFSAYNLFDYMKQKGKTFLVPEDNANDIIIPLMYSKNTTVKSYSGYDAIDVTPQDGPRNAKFPMKHMAGSITIDRFSERQNAGKAKIISYFDSQMKQLEMSFIDSLSTMMFSDGTGNDSKDITGLAALVDATPATGTVGGIDASTKSWWRNYQATATKTTTDFDNLFSAMTLAYNTTSRGKKDHIDFWITTLTVYGGFESLLTKTINYNVGMLNLTDGEMGFENLKFKGSLVTFDEDCTSGYMYGLNTNYIGLHYDRDTFFEPTPFVRPANQDCRTSLLLLYAEFCVSNMAKQAVLTAIT